MTEKEITQMINKKGAVAKDMFDGFYIKIKEWCWYSEIDNDSIATYIYNLTVLGMEMILENPEFFEKECGVTERNRIRMKKDLKNMERLKYPETCIYSDLQMELYEEDVIEQFESGINK